MAASNDSMAAFTSNKFVLNDQEKKECLESIHCNVKTKGNKDEFVTLTSHWVKKKRVPLAVCKLFKIKRWCLLDENFLFDPLGYYTRRGDTMKLTADNTLLRTFTSGNEVMEPYTSIDSIVSEHLSKESMDGLKLLDIALEPLDNVEKSKDKSRLTIYFERMDDNADMLACSQKKTYKLLLVTIHSAVTQRINNESVPESTFEELFKAFATCVTTAMECDAKNDIYSCSRNVAGTLLEPIFLPVTLEKNRKTLLKIKAKPDLFFFYRPPGRVEKRSIILGAVVVKGKRGVDILHSDEESDAPFMDDVPSSPDCTSYPFKPSSKKHKKHPCANTLHSLAEMDEKAGESEEDVDQLDLEQLNLESLMDNTPRWLGRIRDMPPFAYKAVKKFLPQLIGDMLCISRSEAVQSCATKLGMQFGVGVIGFDVYFVTMIDNSHKSPSSILNDEEKFLNVFITRPFNFLERKDRKIIIKVLAAAHQLHRLNF